MQLVSNPTSVPGSGRLRFERVANRTAVVESYAASPLKFVNPSNHGTAAWVVSGTYGGGLLGGDAIGLNIAAGDHTQSVLMTQASTKVYRSDTPALQTLDCTVGSTLRRVVWRASRGPQVRLQVESDIRARSSAVPGSQDTKLESAGSI